MQRNRKPERYLGFCSVQHWGRGGGGSAVCFKERHSLLVQEFTSSCSQRTAGCIHKWKDVFAVRIGEHIFHVPAHKTGVFQWVSRSGSTSPLPWCYSLEEDGEQPDCFHCHLRFLVQYHGNHPFLQETLWRQDRSTCGAKVVMVI